MPDGLDARITSIGTVLLLVIGYLGLAASEHWVPFDNSGPTSTGTQSPVETASQGTGNLGGVDMQHACDAQYPGRSLQAVATDLNNAYSWRCTGPGVSLSIDVTQECIAQYGNGAVSAVANPASAWSWYCYRKT